MASIRLCKPDDSGSLFFNYKNFFSTVLKALVDVEEYGAPSDCNIFNNSDFYKKLEGNHLNILGSRLLPNDDMPMPLVIVGDEAFALSHVLQYRSRNLHVARPIYM
jgi:hypothetical protein